MKKILFFSFLLISSIILVASCESGPSRAVDTRVGPNGCSCVIGATAFDSESGQGLSKTYTQEYSRAQLDGWYTDCMELVPFLEKQYSTIRLNDIKPILTVSCLPK